MENAAAERDALADDEQALAQARQTAMVEVDRGLGARWAAMNDHTLTSLGATVLGCRRVDLR